MMTNHLKERILFVFPAYRYLQAAFNNLENITCGEFVIKRFASNELNIVLETNVLARECIVIASLAAPDENMLACLMLCHTLKKEKAVKVTLIFPYLAYSRHDKLESNKSQAIALIGNLLSTAGADEVMTVDIHTENIKKMFKMPLLSLSPAVILAEVIRKNQLEQVTIVAPDEGAILRAQAIKNFLQQTGPVSYMVKKRSENALTHSEVHGEIRERVLIIDDILDTGKTLVSSCQYLQEKGVKEIYIMVTHGLFTGNEWEKLWNNGVRRIFCTDSSPLPLHVKNNKNSDKITVISISPLLLENIK